jgi:hypothetical protein
MKPKIKTEDEDEGTQEWRTRRWNEDEVEKRNQRPEENSVDGQGMESCRVLPGFVTVEAWH